MVGQVKGALQFLEDDGAGCGHPVRLRARLGDWRKRHSSDGRLCRPAAGAGQAHCRRHSVQNTAGPVRRQRQSGQCRRVGNLSPISTVSSSAALPGGRTTTSTFSGASRRRSKPAFRPRAPGSIAQCLAHRFDDDCGRGSARIDVAQRAIAETCRATLGGDHGFRGFGAAAGCIRGCCQAFRQALARILRRAGGFGGRTARRRPWSFRRRPPCRDRQCPWPSPATSRRRRHRPASALPFTAVRRRA